MVKEKKETKRADKEQASAAKTEKNEAEANPAEKIVGFDTEDVVDKSEAPAPELSEEAKALQALQNELLQMTNRAMRMQADFENYKKRNAEVSHKAFTDGAVTVLTELLPMLDSFDRAVKTLDAETAKGVLQIKKQFETALVSLGVKEIEAEDMPFDPKYHNAVMSVDDEEHAGQVTEVFQKGYIYRDKVVRYAMVKVAK